MQIRDEPGPSWIWVVAGAILAGCGGPQVDEISLDSSRVSVVRGGLHDALPAWPGWRGPTTNGIAPDQAAPIEWGESNNISWRTDVPGRGHGSPIVTDHAVLLATALEDKQQQLVVAFDRRDGAVKWQKVIHEGGFPSPRKLHKKGTHANGTLACDGTRAIAVFLNSGQVRATAVDLAGEILWQQDVGPFESKFGYAPSPILYQSLVIVAADNYGSGFLAAIDRETGKIAWRVQRPTISTYSSPTVATVGGRDQLLISGCHRIASYDPASGELIWETECLAEATCGTVVASEDRIFASGGYPERETVCLDANGKRVWSNKAKIYEPSLLVAGDSLYGVSDDGIAYCWAAESGDVRWKKRLGGAFSASPVLCGGNVFVPDLTGKTWVFAADPELYREVAVNRLGRDCYASPAFADGVIFLRIGVRDGAERHEQLVCIGGE